MPALNFDFAGVLSNLKLRVYHSFFISMPSEVRERLDSSISLFYRNGLNKLQKEAVIPQFPATYWMAFVLLLYFKVAA